MLLHVQMSVLTGRGIREPIDIILRAILNDMQLQIQLAVALQNLKIIVEGDGGVSKMSYINRILTGTFNLIRDQTLEAQIHMVHFHTTSG
jgi:hypothetical protein